MLALCLTALSGSVSAQDDPLEELRGRSAESRWKSLRERFSERRENRRERRADEDSVKTDNEPQANESAVPQSVAVQATPELSAPPARIASVPRELQSASTDGRSLSSKESETVTPGVTRLELGGPLYQELFQLDDANEASDSASDPQFEKSSQASPFPTEPQFSAVPKYSEPSFSKPQPEPQQNSIPANDLTFAPPFPEPAASRDSTPTFLAVPPAPAAKFSTPVSARPQLLEQLPLPAAADQPLRVALQPPMPSTPPVSRLPQTGSSIRDDLFDPEDYVKTVSDIDPFFDYEPNKTTREQDPYRNLCPHPDGISRGEFDCPEVAELPSTEPFQPRQFAHLDYNWAASNINYNPVYFADVNLERYGHSHRPIVQPFVSVGRFTGQMLALPYQMTMHPILEKNYPLGYIPPGDACTPKLYYQPPINLKAAMVTAGVYTGWVFLIP